MKKFLAVLCVLTCMFGVTACGSEKVDQQPYFVRVNLQGDAEAVKDVAVSYFEAMTYYAEEDLVEQLVHTYPEESWVESAAESYESALEDMGSIQAIGDVTITSMDESEVIAEVALQGELKDASVEVIMDEDGSVTSMTVNVERTFGELMENAALNTLLGMGTVFLVLILICFIISGFSLISKVENALKNKGNNKDNKEAVDNTIAQIEEREELSDDTELVAVIAAAIAAYEGTSTDGFVVRSIRKANRNKWLNA